MLPLPAHHGLPLGQIFNPSVTVADFKIALDLMDFTTIPAWLDHPLVDMWFSHFSGPTAPPPMPFTSGAGLLPALPKALFRSTTDTLHDAALICANKIRHSPTRSAIAPSSVPHPSSTVPTGKRASAKPTPMLSAKLSPSTTFCRLRTTPSSKLLDPAPSAPGQPGTDTKIGTPNEANMPPSFRPFLGSRHMIDNHATDVAARDEALVAALHF
jgi:hypothetical protein